MPPLVADLAPEALRGRYKAAMELSRWLGLALAPTLGAQLLGVSPPSALLAAAGSGAGGGAVGTDAGAGAAVRDPADPAAGGTARASRTPSWADPGSCRLTDDGLRACGES
jgi:hypothetical protein